MKAKKIALTLTVTLLAAVLTGCLVACNGDKDTGSDAPAEITVNATAEAVYGDTEFEWTFSLAGAPADVTLASLGIEDKVSVDEEGLAAMPAAGSHECDVVLGEVTSEQYVIKAGKATLTVAQRALSVIAEGQTFTYSPEGVTLDNSKAKVEGLLEGHTASYVIGFDGTGVPGAGEYDLVVKEVKVMDGETDVTANYAVTATAAEGAKLVIEKAPVTFTVGSQSVVYSPDGVTLDNSKVKAEGLLGSHKASFALGADGTGVLDAGEYDLVLNAQDVSITDGETDVTANYAVTVNIEEGAKLTVEKAPVTLTVDSQSAVYSPAGVSPDSSAVKVEGVLGSHKASFTLGVNGTGVLNAGEYDFVLNAADVRIMDGETDVTANYDVTVNIREGAKFTVGKATAQVISAVTEVEWDGNAHTFDAGDVKLADGCTQEVTVSSSATYTDGGIYAYSVTIKGDTNYVEQTVEGLLKIKSVKIGDKSYALEDAIAAAQSGDIIVVCHDTTFSTAQAYADASYRTVKEGVTLLLPFDENHSAELTNVYPYRNSGDNIIKAVPAPYVTLDVPEGLLIVVDGTFTVNAKLTANNSNMMGMTLDNSVLAMGEGSEVLVNDGGIINVLGYVAGSGTVRAKSGGTIAETIVLTGYRGGTISAATTSKIIPFNQYYINNIEVKSVYESGASLVGKGVVLTGGDGGAMASYMHADVLFVGGEDALISLTSGELRKEYDIETGVITMTAAGDFALGNLAIKVSGLSVDSEGKEIPFPGNFDIVLESGTATMDNVSIKLLPGASFTVEKDATLELKGSAKVFVYNNKEFEWTQDGTIGYPVGYVTNCYRVVPTFDYNIKTPAVFEVNGRVNVSPASNIAGAITSTGAGTVSFIAAPTQMSIQEFKTSSFIFAQYFTMTNIAALAGVEKVEAGTYTYDAETSAWIKA